MYLRNFIKLYLNFMYKGGYVLSRELKDRQCTYDVTLRCAPGTITAVEKQ